MIIILIRDFILLNGIILRYGSIWGFIYEFILEVYRIRLMSKFEEFGKRKLFYDLYMEINMFNEMVILLYSD